MESITASEGRFKDAERAGPLSPENPCTPFPASTATVPSPFKRSTTWLPGSAKTMLPLRSEESAETWESGALMPGAPSAWKIHFEVGSLTIKLLAVTCGIWDTEVAGPGWE